MNSPYRLCILTVLFATVVLCWSGADSVGQEKGKGADVPAPPAKWIYKVQTFEPKGNDAFEKELNSLGNEGWELGGVLKSDNSNPRLIFKRPKR